MKKSPCINANKSDILCLKTAFSGLEEFEEKMDTLGEDGEEEPSWLGSILQGVLSEADLKEEEEEEEDEQGGGEGRLGEGEEEDLDYVEPPFLDPRLGGAENTRALVRRRRTTLKQTTTGKQNQRTEEEGNFKNREENFKEEEERSCTVELWWCLAGALEPAVRQLETSGSIAR